MKYEQFILFHVHLRRGLDINRRLRFVYDRRDVKHFTALSRVYEPALPDFMNGISISGHARDSALADMMQATLMLMYNERACGHAE